MLSTAARCPIHSLVAGPLMGAVPICAPLNEKLREGSGDLSLIQLRNSEVLYRRRAERVRIAEAGLRCFNNPSGDNPRYRTIAVIQFEGMRRALS